jgi:hypothetical protein
MRTKNGRNIILAIAAILVAFIIVGFFAVAYINNSPGLYRYTVDIRGLENYESGYITDIIVPLPVRDGQSVFTDDELQYKTFGNWKSLIIVTKFGKMLAFQNVGGNLTRIHATFSKKYPGGTVIRNITQESLSPVLPLVHSDYSLLDPGSDSRRDYSSIVYIPDTIKPLHGGSDYLNVSLELFADEGMQHSISGNVYKVQISERIPPGVYNSTKVVVHVSDRK